MKVTKIRLILGLIIVAGLFVPTRTTVENGYLAATPVGRVLGTFLHRDFKNSETVLLSKTSLICAGGTRSVLLNWQGTTAASIYDIEREYFSADAWQTVGQTNQTSYTDTSTQGLAPGNYLYRITAHSSSGSILSNSQSVHIENCDVAANQNAVSAVSGNNTQTTQPLAVNQSPPPAVVAPPPPPTITQRFKNIFSKNSTPTGTNNTNTAQNQATTQRANKKTTPPPPPAVNPPPPVLLPPPPSQTPPPVAPPPVSKMQWGAFPGGTTTDIGSLESLTGKPMNLVSVFTGWGSAGAFPSEYKPYVGDKGKTLVIFWEQYGTTLDTIISGKDDTYIKQFAASAKNYGSQIILVPFHEMNGNWDPWDGTINGNTPAKVISAWRHVHDIFGTANNVKWGWSPNVDYDASIANSALELYYPGDTYTDYVGLDGFNFGTPWQTFTEVFGSSLQKVSKYNKPIFIFSFASAAGSQKATWITDAIGIQLPKYPAIAGWLWFNQNKEQDWRINSDTNSLNAFKAVLP